MTVTALARSMLLAASLVRDHRHAPVFDAALGDDVIGEMLHLATGAAQRGHLHAIVIIKMHVQRGAIV